MSRAARDNLLEYEKRFHDRLQGVLEGMPVAVSWANLEDQRIEFLNRKFTALFGYVQGDHRTVADWIEQTYIDPDQVKRAQETWYPHFGKTDVELVEIPQVEVDVRCKDGSVKTTLLSGMILPDVGWALAIFVDISERKERESEVARLALEDPLTRLPNRRAFSETLKAALSRARRQQKSCALLIIDLDDFKPLNDALGHDRGDAALQAIADRLRRAIRGEDFVCRLGGDEFAVIVDDITGADVAEEVAQRIVRDGSKPFVVEDNEVSLTVSIGISLYPDEAADADELYRNADLALYRAKDEGGNRASR